MKVWADEVGINLQWNSRTPVTHPGRRSGIAVRVLNVVLVVLGALLIPVFLVQGERILALAWMFIVACNLFALALNTKTAALRKAQAIERNRPRPDYRLIAELERDIYGEAFEHDGAPETRAMVSVRPADLCRNCAARKMVARGFCRDCYRDLIGPQPERAGLCDSGYHVYSYSEPGCLNCHEHQ